MSKTITSTGVTFMDLTDSRKLDAYITSNLPIAQIFNQNTQTYEPDWNTTNLQLNADIYLDAQAVTSNTYTSITWYKKVGTQAKTQVGTGANLTINNNQLTGNVGMITYICEAIYNDTTTNPPTAHAEITFTRVDTGLNGSDGVDGTSVNILGSYNTLAELQAAHPTGNSGDAYIIDGDLYVWAVDDNQWENVGNIQGPAGVDGQDAKNIILTGDSQVFKVSKTNVVTPSTIKVTTYTFNTTITNWTYSTNGGQTFLSTVPTGVSRNGSIVTVTGSAITSNSITIKASDGEIEDVFTVYKAVDGLDGDQGSDGAPAPIAFLTNENITFSANAQGQISGTTITSNVVAYNGTTKVTPTIGTISGAPTGMTITPSTITASNEVMLTITIANNSTLGSASSNMGVISIPITSPISTVLSLTWSKVNTGVAGTSASLVDITPSALYFKSTTGKDGTFDPEFIYLYPRFQNATYNGWQYSTDGGINWTNATISNGLSIGLYNGVTNTLRVIRSSSLYTDTVTSISFRCNTLDSNVYDVVSIAKIYDVADFQIGGRNYILNSANLSVSGLDSADGSQGEYRYIDVGQSYMEIANDTDVTISFDLEMTVNTANPTLMVYNTNRRGPKTFAAKTLRFTATVGDVIKQRCSTVVKILDTEEPTRTTNAIEFYSTYGTSNWFKISNLKLEKGNQPTDWTPAPEDLIESAANVNVMLSNEAHFFEADATGIPKETSIVLEVIGYKGSIRSQTTVGAIGGLPSAGMTVTISDNNTTSTKITVKVTTALTSAIADYGTLTIPITVNGNTINRVFSWSKAKAGVSASFVDIVPSALYFKSTTGKDGTFTPDYIYLYPRFQNVTYVGWQYSTDGGITWAAASGASGLLVTTHNSISNVLRISRTSALYTDTITSISFRCLTSNTSIYDTVSIVKIYDVVDLEIGGRNLLYDSTFNEGSVWPQVRGTIVSAESDKPNSKIYHVLHTNESTTTATSSPIQNNRRMYLNLKTGESLTMSYDFYTDDLNKVGTTVATLRMSDTATSTTITSLANHSKTQLLNAGVVAGKWQRVSFTYTATTDLSGWFIFGLYVRAEIGASADYKYREVKVEKGNRATDWTPAPEDVDAQIERVDTRLTDVAAELKVSNDNITARVSSTEDTIKTINNNITSLSTRVSTSEQKITDDAIVSTVRQSTDYINDLGQKVGSDEIISKINQTAESITIEANKIGLLGATNIPDLTADKIKGGTLTLGGSSATTQDGQLLVKNASNTDVLKVNKDGIVVKSGHLAVAEDFQNSRYNWEDDSWTTTTNTRQLDLASDYLRTGIYTSSGYTPYMVLSDTGLTFQGVAQGVGSWGSYIGHDWDQLDFVIQDTVRSNISFRGSSNEEMAKISGEGFYVNGPVSGGITSGNARQWSNVFTKNFPSAHTGYIAIRLGTITRAANSMITIKGHITSYHNSSTFEASCYFYSAYTAFYGTVATMSNPDVLKEVYFAEGVSDGCVYLILGGANSNWSYPTVAVDSLTVGFSGQTAYEWNSGWTANVHSNLSSFKTVTACMRGGMKTTLWSGVAGVGQTLTLQENLRNFKFLTCIMGTTTEPYGITMGAFLDDEIGELHFSASFTATNGRANSNVYGAKFTIPSSTSVTLVGCGTLEVANLSVRKIVGWR